MVIERDYRLGWWSKLWRGCAFCGLTWGTPPVAVAAQDDTGRVDYLGDPLPQGALLRLGTVRFSPGPIYYSVLSGDDRVVINLGQQSCGWDALTGRKLWSFEMTRDDFETAFMTSAASYGYQPIGHLVKSGRLLYPERAGAWSFVDVHTGNKTPAFSVETAPRICAVDVNREETLFAIGTPLELIVCDGSGKTQFKVPNRPAKKINELADRNDRLASSGEFSYARFSPDGTRLVLVNSEKPTTLQVWDPLSGGLIREIETADRVVRWDFSPDGQFLATTERDIAARLYDLDSGSRIWERIFSPAGPDERYTTDIRFSPEGTLLAVGTAIGEDNRIHLINSQGGDTLGTLTGHSWKPWSINFSSDGRRLYSSGWDSVIRVWDVAQREQIRVENSERAGSVCTLTQDGLLLAYTDDSGKIHVVESASGKKLRTIAADGFVASQLAFAADGQTLVAGGAGAQDISVLVWNLQQDQPLCQWHWPKGRDVHANVTSLSLTPDGKRLAVAVFRQSKAYVFDLPENRQIAEFPHRQIYGLGLHPDGRDLVTAGWDSRVRLWNVDTGEVARERTHELTIPNGRDSRMYGVRFSPDNQRLATLNMSGSISILDYELNLVREIPFPGRPVYDCFNFSKNGLWVAVGLMSGQACVVDVHTGEQLRLLNCHQKGIYNIEFGPSDRTLLTGGTDGVNYLWDLHLTGGTESRPARALADQMLLGEGLAAFNAFQALAATPAEAWTAVAASVDDQFATFGTVKPDRVAETVQQLLNNENLNEAFWREVSTMELGTLFACEHSLSDHLASAEADDFRGKNLQSLRDQRDRRLWSLSRAFYLAAILDSPEAETQLQIWLRDAPHIEIKKQVFRAKRYRDLW